MKNSVCWVSNLVGDVFVFVFANGLKRDPQVVLLASDGGLNVKYELRSDSSLLSQASKKFAVTVDNGKQVEIFSFLFLWPL